MPDTTPSRWGALRRRLAAAKKKPKSRSRRVAEALAATLLLAYLLLLCFPQVVFAHSVTYRCFRVYSAATIDSNIYPILDRAEQKLAGSEISDSRASYHVFLCPSHAAYGFFAPGARRAFAANLRLVPNIFVNTADVRADAVTTGTGQHDRRTLSGVVAHECTHTLLVRKFGLARSFLLPSWKQEGYCDYVAQETSFDREEGARLLKRGGSDPSPSFLYFKAFTAISYLKGQKQWSVSRIMDSPLSLDEVIREATPLRR